MQFIDQLDQQPLLIGPCGIVRVPEDRGTYLFGRQLNAPGEERDVYSPLVSTAAARASAVNHDLSAADGKRKKKEQAGCSEAVIDARHAGKRRKQCQGRYA